MTTGNLEKTFNITLFLGHFLMFIIGDGSFNDDGGVVGGVDRSGTLSPLK